MSKKQFFFSAVLLGSWTVNALFVIGFMTKYYNNEIKSLLPF